MDEALPRALDAYFSTPPPVPTWRDSHQDPPAPPPDRFELLLDHEYTEAGLCWPQLKGNDRKRVQAMRSAADAVGCNCALAQVEVCESWQCEEPYEPYGYGRGRHRSWYNHGNGWQEEDTTRTDPGDYEEASPADGLAQLAAQARRGEACDSLVESFLPSWKKVVAKLDVGASMDDILAVCKALASKFFLVGDQSRKVLTPKSVGIATEGRFHQAAVHLSDRS